MTAQDSITVAAAQLGQALGLPGPAPEAATRRALSDPEYARALKAVRMMPALRDQMLAAPDSARIRKPGAAIAPEPTHAAPPRPAQAEPRPHTSPPSTAKLAAQAAGAALKWGMTGLKQAQPWVIERRLSACNACEFHAPAPDTLAYRSARKVAGDDVMICTSCHCITKAKAAMASEHCPERDPHNPHLSRWQEPWAEKA
ncbi:MAG: hypothetical protein AAF672_01630 [Pseudomonadota bacterium]